MKKIVFIGLIVFFISATQSAAGLNQQFSSVLQKARTGNIEAMCELGRMYFYGKGTLKDPFKARCWVKKAYDMGSRKARNIWYDLELWQYSGKCEGFDDEPVQADMTGQILTEPLTGMQFVHIPAGCFVPGCNGRSGPEPEKHEICVKGFWMGRFEVTQQVWQQIMGTDPSLAAGRMQNPVENISVADVEKFISILNARTGKKFSLPTIVQWEYACRNAGRNPSCSPWQQKTGHIRPRANCGTCDTGSYHGETAPVGSFLPSELDLFDMAGNVMEWCRPASEKMDIMPASGSPAMGGSFIDNASQISCSRVKMFIRGMKSGYIGFRLVLETQNR